MLASCGSSGKQHSYRAQSCGCCCEKPLVVWDPDGWGWNLGTEFGLAKREIGCVCPGRGGMWKPVPAAALALQRMWLSYNELPRWIGIPIPPPCRFCPACGLWAGIVSISPGLRPHETFPHPGDLSPLSLGDLRDLMAALSPLQPGPD